MNVSVDYNVSERTTIKVTEIVTKHAQLQAGSIGSSLTHTATRTKKLTTTRVRTRLAKIWAGMGVATGVGCKLASMVDPSLVCDHFKPGVGSVTELPEGFLQFENPSEGFGLFGVDGLEDSFVNLRCSGICKLFWLPAPERSKRPSDVLSAGGVELL